MHKQKYIKYKNKYIKYKNKHTGSGNKSLVIHIAGASGSGKTFLGNKLTKEFGNKIVVKDLDDLREEYFIFNEKNDVTFDDFYKNYKLNYQKFIDDFIQENNKKPIIFVGLNTYIRNEVFYFKNIQGKYPKHFFDVSADYKFYIDIDENTILRQRFDREFTGYIDWFADWMKNRKDVLFNNLIQNEDIAKNDICIALTKIMNFSQIKKDIHEWNKFYHDNGYVFLSLDKIYAEIVNILSL